MKRAFTLIELLVVIAIIAILAAILFPVFAQAKAAAKDSTAMSNFKQLGTGMVVYSNDYDDMFSPAVTLYSGGTFEPWQFTIYPYTKSTSIILDPRLPSPPSDTSSAAWYYQSVSHMMVISRGTSNSSYVAPSGTSYGNWYFVSTSQTGGQSRLIEGIFGNSVDPDPSAQWGSQANSNSYTTTAVANPSDMIMITEGGLWDGGWGFTTGRPMNTYYSTGVWVDTTLDVVPGKSMYCGPHSRKTAKSNTGFGTSSAGLPYPDGKTTYVATDSSAHVSDWKGGIVGSVVTTSGGLYAMKHLYAPGGN